MNKENLDVDKAYAGFSNTHLIKSKVGLHTTPSLRSVLSDNTNVNTPLLIRSNREVLNTPPRPINYNQPLSPGSVARARSISTPELRYETSISSPTPSKKMENITPEKSKIEMTAEDIVDELVTSPANKFDVHSPSVKSVKQKRMRKLVGDVDEKSLRIEDIMRLQVLVIVQHIVVCLVYRTSTIAKDRSTVYRCPTDYLPPLLKIGGAERGKDKGFVSANAGYRQGEAHRRSGVRKQTCVGRARHGETEG